MGSKRQEVRSNVCGQCGLILERVGPVGHLLRVAAGAMLHRGPDSTGFALYGEEPSEDRIVVRARIADGSRADELFGEITRHVTSVRGQFVGEPEIRVGDVEKGAFCRLLIGFDGPPAVLLGAIETVEGVYVHSMGRRLEIVKDVGTAEEVAERHGVEDFLGTHGLAHSRLATESTVDVEMSHPFWARPFLDVAIAHNGQLTNYYKMRRLMTQRGLEFLTGNDSELIAVYIAEQLSLGRSLEDALRRSITDLDGVFTYLLATEAAVGCATDPLAIKPLVVTNVEGTLAMATEEQALRRVFDSELVTEYVREGAAVVWDVMAARTTGVGAYRGAQ